MTVRNPDDVTKPASPERRGFLKVASLGGAGAALGALAGKAAADPPRVELAQAQPPQAQWWPSRWGKDDMAGASNWITPEKVLDAVKWIKDGKVYRLGHPYESTMPKFGDRAFTLRMVGSPTGGPYGGNKLVYNDEFLATEIGQCGTQFDGLGHIGIQLGTDGDKAKMHYYNGHTQEEIGGHNGLRKLGIEHIKPFFTRGHLYDLMAVKGAMLEVGEEITLAQLRQAMARQNVKEDDVKQGDAIFFHTGWSSLWQKNNDKYVNGQPGIGVEVARWAAQRGVCVVGADNWGVEVVPNPDKNLAFPVHGELITKNGIFLSENMQFNELIRDRKYQFVYIFSPVPVKGATGSINAPIAVT
jgi:kynurenine formamidase